MTGVKRVDGQSGMVFNIQRYSLHDGPGIRTLVFLKGCPLRCQWCSNPESQRLCPELALNAGKCIGTRECSRCIGECPNGAIRENGEGGIRVERDACHECFRCVGVCPSLAMSRFGKEMNVDEVLREVEADGAFYSRSGGGLTVGGGEPLFQPEFTRELLREAVRRRINTSMETCGFAPWEALDRACRYLDGILYDIKSMDPGKHAEFTGISNEIIVQNFRRLRNQYPNLHVRVRTPVVPGFNDTEAVIGAIVDFIGDDPGVEYELLAYHRFGLPKYGYLDRSYPLGARVLDNGRMKILEELSKKPAGKERRRNNQVPAG